VSRLSILVLVFFSVVMDQIWCELYMILSITMIEIVSSTKITISPDRELESIYFDKVSLSFLTIKLKKTKMYEMITI